jgi:hypothetical protein
LFEAALPCARAGINRSNPRKHIHSSATASPIDATATLAIPAKFTSSRMTASSTSVRRAIPASREEGIAHRTPFGD